MFASVQFDEKPFGKCQIKVMTELNRIILGYPNRKLEQQVRVFDNKHVCEILGSRYHNQTDSIRFYSERWNLIK